MALQLASSLANNSIKAKIVRISVHVEAMSRLCRGRVEARKIENQAFVGANKKNWKFEMRQKVALFPTVHCTVHS